MTTWWAEVLGMHPSRVREEQERMRQILPTQTEMFQAALRDAEMYSRNIADLERRLAKLDLYLQLESVKGGEL